MRNIEEIIENSPHPSTAHKYWSDIKPDLRDLLIREKRAKDCIFCLGASSYIARYLIQNQDWIEEFFIKKDFLVRKDFKSLLSSSDFINDLVKLWRKEHIRIGIKDLLQLQDLPSILKELSDLADGVIESVSKYTLDKAKAKFGIYNFNPSYVVIALGKLGGQELNYYSDLDLMYLYNGNPAKDEIKKFYYWFFTELTKNLSAYTSYGKLYNVDLRLRPQGRKGLIALPLEGYEIYYQSFGRTWERAMLIKSRMASGDEKLFEDFLNVIKPFVYRKYLDYSAIEEIRNLKVMIDNEERKSKGINIKTGRGGIREIEFIVQAFQLAFGGREPWIRERNTLIALHRIYTKGLLGPKEYDILVKAYLFLRKLENRLQMVNCSQTHILPSKREDLERIALTMGYEGKDPIGRFMEDYKRYSTRVREIFEAILSDKTSEIHSIPDYSSKFGDAKEYERCVSYIVNGKPGHPLPEAARQIASEIVEDLVKESLDTLNPLLALKNLIDFMDVMEHSKTTFYSLLKENPNFRKALLAIFGGSQFLTRLLMTHPEHLDFLFEEAITGEILPMELMIKEIMKDTENMDYHERLNYLRRFKQLTTMRIGIADLLGIYSLVRVFNEWSKLADVCIKVIHTWLQEKGVNKAEIGIIALGKLGGREITYHSDLDIIFLGDRDQSYYIDYYTKFIRALTLQSKYGNLFEVDTRLRPFGSKGVMVNTPDNLKKYFEKFARTWERLAFSKFRVIVGEDLELVREAESIIKDFVYYKKAEDLEKDILNIRLKMQDELGRGNLNFKYSSGGIVDVEFISQYLNIKYRLFKVSTLSALCAAKRKGYLDYSTYKRLRENYLFLRKLENLCRLIFYPPLKEFPQDKQRLDVLAKCMGIKAKDLIERFWQVRRENRDIFVKVLG